MAATIGSTIKRLRRAQNMTQEKLSEYLGVSPQAVSQWECGKSVPDLSLIVPLANVFGVTIDALFDRDTAAEEAEVEELVREGNKFLMRGRHDEYLAFWRKAAAKYPRNYQCMVQLAGAIRVQGEDREERAAEVIRLCERILDGCTDASIRDGAIQKLVFLYSNPNLSCANEEKAVAYAKLASSCYTCNEVLLEFAYFTDAHRRDKMEMRHWNILTFLHFVTSRIVSEQREDDAEYIRAQEAALRLWETVIPDGNYLFYHNHVSEIHKNLACRYAQAHHREKTVAHLRLALEHAAAYDRLPCGEHRFTSVLVCAARDHKLEPLCVTEHLKHEIEADNRFDFIRDDPGFVALMES